MTEPSVGPPPPAPQLSGLAGVLLAPLRVAIAVVVVFDELLRPLYRPVIRWFGSLRLIKRMEAAIAGLPPYGILAVLAVPVIGVEPLKVVALLWMGQGRLVAGVILMAAAYAGSFLLVERVYSAGEAQLMRIGWFARGMGLVRRVRSAVLDWVRATRTYAAAMAAVRWTRAMRAALVRRIRGGGSHPG